jgi:hypothetical protein
LSALCYGDPGEGGVLAGMPAWPMAVVVEQVAEAQQHGGSPRSRANAQQIGRPWPGALQPYDDRAGVAGDPGAYVPQLDTAASWFATASSPSSMATSPPDQ